MPIHETAIDLLDQLKVILKQLTDEQLARPIEALSGSSIGGHVRHSLEFFLCLLDAAASGMINYDHRKHDPYVERDVKLALNILEEVQSRMNACHHDHPLLMQVNYELYESESLTIHSSVHRELAYNIEHTLHHMALIKVGLANFPQVQLPVHFGIASSTVRFQKSRQN